MPAVGDVLNLVYNWAAIIIYYMYSLASIKQQEPLREERMIHVIFLIVYLFVGPTYELVESKLFSDLFSVDSSEGTQSIYWICSKVPITF